MKLIPALVLVVISFIGACDGSGSTHEGLADAAIPVDSGSDRQGVDVDQTISESSDGGPSDIQCWSGPSTTNVVVRFFDRIFVGTFSVSNHFDHDEPKEFLDQNDFQIDTCGRRRTTEIDGHSGYDFRMSEGTPLLAPADGIVNWAGNDIRFFCPLKGTETEDQLRVEITHMLPDGSRVTSNFKHLSRVDVRSGQRIYAGDQIGLSGNTGCSTGPHLHFENWLMDGTKTGKSVLIDSFGWEGNGSDPWAAKPDGAVSIWLWKVGQEPHIGP